MTNAPTDDADAQLARLRKRLDREQRGREESEAIAERALTDLYKKQQEIELLHAITVAANEATSVESAIQIALDRVCRHTGWPVGHAYLRSGPDTLAPTAMWHLENATRFAPFRAVTEGTHFQIGVGLPGRVLETAKPEWISDVTEDLNFPRARIAADSGLRAAFGFPISIASEVVAVLEFFTDEAAQLDEGLLGVMGQVGTQLGRVVERTRANAEIRAKSEELEIAGQQLRVSLTRLEQELSAARALQMAMLPREFPPPMDPVQLHAYMEPAREVGGDLYDFFYIAPDRFCFLVGDVSGKGAPAAMFMARTRSLVRLATDLCWRFAESECMPGSLAQSVNRELCQNNSDRMFVTLFLGFVDTTTGVVTYINAGHPAPYVLGANGELRRLAAKAQLPLGVRPQVVYDMHSVALRAGDKVFVCSDGLAEAANADGELYGEDRIEAKLRQQLQATPGGVVSALRDAIEQFGGDAPKADDLTMLALRWREGARG